MAWMRAAAVVLGLLIAVGTVLLVDGMVKGHRLAIAAAHVTAVGFLLFGLFWHVWQKRLRPSVWVQPRLERAIGLTIGEHALLWTVVTLVVIGAQVGMLVWHFAWQGLLFGTLCIALERGIRSRRTWFAATLMVVTGLVGFLVRIAAH